MLRNLAGAETGSVFEHDICIVGAGAAGITLAKELEGSGLSVALLESGTFEHSYETWELYAGEWKLEGLGQSLRSDIEMKNSRLRWFGGSTNHWGGFCAPFDEMDFEKREWVPHSGWPMRRADLDAYYERACEYCGVPSFDYSIDEYRNHPVRPLFDFGENSKITTKMYHASTEDPSGIGTPTNFGKKYRTLLSASRNVTVYLDATCRKLHLNQNGSAIEKIDVKTVTGRKPISFRAKKFVLACGGLENVRLLLNSNDVLKEGIGNQNDLVGRYFQGHAHFALDPGLIFSLRSQTAAGLEFPLYSTMVDPITKHHSFGFFVVKPEYQSKYQLLNCNMGIAVWTVGKKAVLDEDKHVLDSLKAPVFGESKESRAVIRQCQINVEQDPNLESRITLLEERDFFGDAKIGVVNKITELQKYTALKSFELLGGEFAAAGVGRVKLEATSKRLFDSLLPSLGSHHIGATRMSDDPHHGVVDQDCRVFDVANLHIAGSSVFPTGSCANPTFTIVALALRLADHLKTVKSR